jgi:hypothetical protein
MEARMGLFDGLLGHGSIDLGSLAGKVGLNEQELIQGGEALMTHLASGDHTADSAATAASAETGVDAGKLMAVLPALATELGHGDTGGLMNSLTGEGGLLSSLGGAGNVMNEVGGFAKGLFGSKS